MLWNSRTGENVCSVLWRMFSSLGDTISTLESVQYFGGCSVSCGVDGLDVIKTVEVIHTNKCLWFSSTVLNILHHSTDGIPPQYLSVLIVPLQSAEHPPMYWLYPSTVLHRRSPGRFCTDERVVSSFYLQLWVNTRLAWSTADRCYELAFACFLRQHWF